MQNIPDKGVRVALCYLKAEYTVTGLSGSLQEVKRRLGKGLRDIPVLGGVTIGGSGVIRYS